MTEKLTVDDLSACGAHQRGHFRLSSGLHSSDYLQCALFLAHPGRAERAGVQLAQAIAEAVGRPQLIVAPALGGIIIGHETARALGTPSLFTERVNGAMTLRRGFGIGEGQEIVVVEDVVTTGGSTLEVIELLESLGGSVVGVASMVNRSVQDNPFGALPYAALIRAVFQTWPPDDCPLCRAGEPLVKPGSRPVS